MPDFKYETNSVKSIQRLLRDARAQHSKVATRMKVRRQLIIRDSDDILDNLTGTYLAPPFDKSVLAIRTIIGETAKAVQHYASRIAANDPTFDITPPTPKGKITATVDKTAGEQEELLATLWTENGGREKQWDSGMNMAVGGVSYYLTLPRDADFGLPDRLYYDAETDEEIRSLRRDGKLTPMKVPHPQTGKWVYAEHGDVWAARRKEAFAQPGRSLFTLECFPRDMVYVGKDTDGIKWAAIVEQIPGTDCEPGSETAQSYARAQGTPEDDVGLYGIWQDKQGRIIGGVPRGNPIDSGWKSPDWFTKVRFFNRVEMSVLIAKDGGSLESGVEVFRGKHGAKQQGHPVCPVVEVAMMRTGINVAGQEFTTPMEAIFAYVPIINQMLTLLSNAVGFNLLPRWIVELRNGTTLRGEDGEPKEVEQETTPGLDPRQAAAYEGTVKQLLIDTQSAQVELALLYERLQEVSPSGAATGEAGSSSAAWQVRLQIQQSQENLRQAVGNHARAVNDIEQMWIAWMRDLDLPIYFYAAAGYRSDRRTVQGLIDLDPKVLTDAFSVSQELDTPEEQTVRIQQGLELRAQNAITWADFFRDYLRKQDAREAEIDMYVQQVTDQVINGAQFPPGSLIDMIAKGMQGELHYMLIQQSDNYALSTAEQMAQQAQQPMQPSTPPPTQPTGGGGVAEAAGIRQPGVGMANDLQSQLGSAVPGGMTPAQPVAA